MAEVTYTNLTALEAVAEILAEHSSDDALAAKIAKMIESETRKREAAKNAPKVESKQKKETRIKRIAAMRAIVEAGNEPRTAAWIGEHVNFMETSNKVSGAFREAMKDGLLEYGDKVDGKVTWRVTDKGMAYLETV